MAKLRLEFEVDNDEFRMPEDENGEQAIDFLAVGRRVEMLGRMIADNNATKGLRKWFLDVNGNSVPFKCEIVED
jgi:hypothetical protein